MGDANVEMLMLWQMLKLMLIMALQDTEAMEDMDTDANAEMLMLNQKLKLMLTTDMVDMEDTADMDMDASADLLLLKHLQLLIMAMEDTVDMVVMDMAVNEELLSPTMDMEGMEVMGTDMDVKMIRIK